MDDGPKVRSLFWLGKKMWEKPGGLVKGCDWLEKSLGKLGVLRSESVVWIWRCLFFNVVIKVIQIW